MKTILPLPTKLLLPFAFLAMVLSFASLSAQQIGDLVVNTTSEFPFANPDQPYGNRLNVWTFEILDDPSVSLGCDNQFKYSVNYLPEPYDNPSSADKAFWPTLPGGPGMKQFTARITYKVMAHPNQYRFMQDDNFYVFINGVECTDCFTVAVWEAGEISCDEAITQLVTVHYPATDVYETDGIWDFALSPQLSTSAYDCNTSWDWDCLCDAYNGLTGYELHYDELPSIRFTAVMAGSSFTEQLGNFTTPENLTCILRDPPGDMSYSRWEQGTTQCFGSSFYSSTETEVSTWSSVKYGFGVPLLFDAEIEGTLTTSTAESNSETYEVQTCVDISTAYETNSGGIPADDLFIGSSINYAYGMATTVHREGCEIIKQQGLAIAPLTQVTEFAHRESHIRQTVIPQLEAVIDILTPGSIESDAKIAQLDVWNQSLAMNDEIKAEAALYDLNPIENWSSGTIKENTVTLSSSETRAIDMKVRLSAGLGIGYTLDLGWAEVAQNLQIDLRTEYGSTETNISETENTLFYSMQDNDDDQNGGNDVFSVNIMKDNIFGTSVFVLNEETSVTSCPYEGGVAVEQPQLWIGAEGQSTMVVENVPVGETADFPIILCNQNPTRTVDYLLTANSLTVNDNAIITAFSTDLNSNDQTQPYPPNSQCITGTLSLEQFYLDVLDYEDIEILFSSGCGDDISSSVLISAHFSNTDGVQELTGTNGWFAVSPNPSNGIFRLTAKGVQAPMTFTVTDLIGRTVLAPRMTGGSDNLEIDLSEFPSGMYILIAEKDGQRQTTRLMLEH